MTNLKPNVLQNHTYLLVLFLCGFLGDCFLLQNHLAAQSSVMLSLLALVFMSFRYQGILTLVFLFLIGFLYDALLGTVMGFTSLMWLSLHLLVVKNTPHFLHKSIGDAWLGYGFVAFVWSMSHWLMHLASLEGVWAIYKPFMTTLILLLPFPLLYRHFARGGM